jgi:UDP-glucose-4-epimerase GalE
MAILITGGAGYIGSHTAKRLHAAGRELVVLDNLSTGSREHAQWGTFVEGEIADVPLVRRLIREHGVTQVLHLAACARVAESMRRPSFYFTNNTAGTAALLEAMIAEQVLELVFASSCSIYGNSDSATMRESDPVVPVSPYGESKLQTERSLPWYTQAHGLRWLALRYFNAAGADPGDDGLGEVVSESIRIIPRTVHAAIGDGPALQVFGSTYPTPDGTSVRDFVHVSDVVHANILALDHISRTPAGEVLNIGSGKGVSVAEIIQCVSRLAGRPVPHTHQEARVGDPAQAISDPARADQLLHWAARHSALDTIVQSILRTCRSRTSL